MNLNPIPAIPQNASKKPCFFPKKRLNCALLERLNAVVLSIHIPREHEHKFGPNAINIGELTWVVSRAGPKPLTCPAFLPTLFKGLAETRGLPKTTRLPHPCLSGVKTPLVLERFFLSLRGEDTKKGGTLAVSAFFYALFGRPIPDAYFYRD
ncbi:MAG: hypothetical protein D6714_15170 [Bacteroidetes bacterium]|nr:MAG: hypothetical protein D6714_15170 [Bacteroidota bacterium]